MVSSETYLVATIRGWNIDNASKMGYEVISNPDDLTVDLLEKIKPRYVFFPHWSWIIPPEIYSNYECVVFHMTELPFGRGGSPLQNLISRGIYETKISAIRVSKGIDTGPVYLKRDLSLHGNAEEIYIRCSDIVFEMIKYIIENEPTPIDQLGEPVVFKRRKPHESEIPDTEDLVKVYDYIRMLDVDGYPLAFVETDKLRLEFSRASRKHDCIMADVKITRK